MIHVDARRGASRRLARPGARLLVLLAAAAGLGLLASGAYEFFDSYSTDARVDAGPVSRFPPHTVTYIAAARAFVVHEHGDDIFALYEQSSWVQMVHPSWAQCHVRWYPVPADAPTPSRSQGWPRDLSWDAYATATASDHGLFREPCSGSAFDVYGNSIFGPSTPLDRDAVRIANGRVVIDTGTRTRTIRPWPTAAAR